MSSNQIYELKNNWGEGKRVGERVRGGGESKRVGESGGESKRVGEIVGESGGEWGRG